MAFIELTGEAVFGREALAGVAGLGQEDLGDGLPGGQVPGRGPGEVGGQGLVRESPAQFPAQPRPFPAQIKGPDVVSQGLQERG